MKSKIIKYLDIIVEYAIYLTIFFIPISITMIGTFAGMAMVFFLIKKIIFPDFSIIKANKMLFTFLLLFFVFMGLSLINSGPLLIKSLKALLIKWGRYPLLLWVVIETFQNKGRVIRAVYVLSFSATLVGLTVFTQKFFGFEFLRGKASGGFFVPSIGPFKNQNALAAYLTCVIPVILCIGLWKWKRVVTKLGFLLIIVVLILSSFWTTCRGGWFGLLVGFAYLIMLIGNLKIKQRFRIIFVVALSFFVSVMASIIYFSKLGIDMWRLRLFYGAWDMIKENPFLGKGIGTYMDYSPLYTKYLEAGYVHNCYLQIWAESGIFSLLFLLLFVVYVLYKTIKNSTELFNTLSSCILIGLTAGLIGFLVHSFFDVHFYSFQLAFLFWIVLGLTVALSAKLNQESFSKK